MLRFLRRKPRSHALLKGFPVSGFGYTEYHINFCRKCGLIFWRLTKDYDNLYPMVSKDSFTKLPENEKWYPSLNTDCKGGRA